MNIDPRHMKQLLQLSAMRPLDLHSSDNKRTTSSADFQQLLSDIMLASSSAAETAERASSSTAFDWQRLMGIQPYEIRSYPVAKGEKEVAVALLVQAKAARYGVDPNLVMTVIQAESSFNPYAVSRAGAKGLMQLMDGTAAELGVRDPFNPEENIDGGVRYLSMLIDKYDGNVRTALAAYNAGPGLIDRLGIQDDADLRSRYELLPQETQRYVDKVMAYYEQRLQQASSDI